MNENTKDYKDTQLLISEADTALSQGENLNSFPQEDLDYNEKDLDLPPSNLLERTLDKENDEKISVPEEAEGIQMKELLLSSSDDVILSPSLEPEEEMELKKEQMINKCLKSTIKRFFASYCEVSTAACLLRERWVLLLSVFVCSKAVLEIKDTDILVPRLFLVSYCCLVYQMIEKMLQYRFLRITTTNLRNEKAECLFDFADKALILFFVSILHLQYYKLVNEWFTVLAPLFFLLEILAYRKNCLIVGSQDDMKIVARIFYVLQSFMIAVKITKIVDFEWKGALIFLWIYLCINALYALFAGLLLVAVCLTSVLNLDGRTLCFLRTRILGYIWHIGCYMLNGIGIIILFGLFEKIDSNEDDTMQLGLLSAKNLSSFLVAYSAFLFPLLKRLQFNLFQDLGTTLQNQRPKKYAIVKTEEYKREAFFLMVSSTYFSLLRDISQAQFEEMGLRKNDIENPQNKEEGSLCYICESNASNAILAGCGHGGVCCECALKLVEQKNECMGCRKPATAIYKIENNESTNNPAEGIVKAHELVEIIEI